MAGIADKVFNLIKDAVESQGVSLWDVKFLKEGASHYLRVFIDSPDGICIDDCTAVSHAIDPIIDDADPIDVSYYLEVCSPGLERQLSREEHFTASIGKPVKLRLFKGIDGKKEFSGTLISYENGSLVIESDGQQLTFEKGSVAKANLEDF